MMHDLLRITGQANTDYAKGGGSYINLFDAHPPFQIDGNFGGVSGMSEMLLQSHLGEIHLLAALPDEWAAGEIKGLKARGDFEISMVWKNKRLVTAQIKSLAGGVCKIRSSTPFAVKDVAIKTIKSGDYYLLGFNSVKGKTYELMGK
jgi:alpha-L-fucosidase 2